MILKLDELTEFDNQIYRNIQGIPLGFDEFDDLTDDPKAKIYAHRASLSNKPNLGIPELQYHAIDFIFKQKSWLPTRFSDGSYPVWYGSGNLETSIHETLYHWQKIYLEAPQNFIKHTKQPIVTLRTVFTVNCKAALIDLRKKSEIYNELSHPDPTHYSYTQELGQRIHREGYPGLISKSARLPSGEIIVAFKKEILSTPEHFNDYLYEYDAKAQKTSVKYRGSNKILLSL